MIIKEWRCKAHGNFESGEDNPTCPHGCNVIERVFLTAPSFRSDSTKRMDSNMESLAKSHNLTDMSNRGGNAVLRQNPNQAKQQSDLAREISSRYGNGWGNIPKGATTQGVLSKYHATPDNVVGQLKDSGAFVPKPVRYIKDHENLQVNISKG